jgi:nucleoid-associated protein YgaU
VAGRDTFRDRFQSVADAIADGAEEATSLLRDAQDNPVAARTGPISMMEMGRAPERPSEPDVEDDAATRSATTPERMWRTHRVAEGESLWGIADEYYGDGALYTELAESNGGRVGEDGRVRVGASILIPPRDELGSPAGAGTRVADGSSSREPEPGAEPDRRYTIRKGDTLGEISQRLLGTSKRWREIMELNEDVIDDEDVVPVGVTIKIPSR